MAPFRFLEEVALADAAFEATGDTLSDLFEAAAQAVIETLVNPVTITPTCRKTIERRAPDLPSLLFDWLSDIVYLKDAEGLLFKDATVAVQPDQSDGSWVLRATLAGEPIDPTRHELRADVKAVTKHLFEVRQDGRCWVARVVLDI
jgi:SHS2 domain-containing protein